MTEFSEGRRNFLAGSAAGAVTLGAIPSALASSETLSPIESEILRERREIPNGKELKQMVDFVFLKCTKGSDYYIILADEKTDERIGLILEIVNRVSHFVTKAYEQKEKYPELAQYFALPNLPRATCRVDLEMSDTLARRNAGLGSFVRVGDEVVLVAGKHPIAAAGTRLKNIYVTTEKGSQMVPLASMTREENAEDQVVFGLSKSQCDAFDIDIAALPELDVALAKNDVSGALVANYVPKLYDGTGPTTVFSFELPFGNGMRGDSLAAGLNQSPVVLSGTSFTLKPKEWGDMVRNNANSTRANFTTGSPMCVFVGGRYVFRAISTNIQVTKDAKKWHAGISTFPPLRSVIALAQRAIDKRQS